VRPLSSENEYAFIMYTRRSSRGSTRGWLAYMGRGFQVLFHVHVSPRSSERYSPARRSTYAVDAL
jgi:hypothetical protein